MKPGTGSKRPRATDLDDPSRPEVRPPRENLPIASSSYSRPGVLAHGPSSSTPTLALMHQPEVLQFHQERPRWDRMREQVLRLPSHIPHCLPFIVDETMSMSPEEAQSTIQACVSSMPNPSLSIAQSNAYYGQYVRYESVYHQIPSIIVHINAQDLPTPPRPLAGLPLTRTFPEFDQTFHPRRSPTTFSFSQPWQPFLPSSMSKRAPITPEGDLIYTSQGGISIVRATVERLIGPGSVLKDMESHVNPFLNVLTRLDIFGTWKDEHGPDSRLLLDTAEEWTNLTDLQSRLTRVFSSSDRAMAEVERLNNGIDVLEAIDQYAVRVALDACALLGGVELPTWPSSPNFAGTWVDQPNRSPVDKPVTYISQCRARDCERWGIPCWVESPRRHYSRLEASPFSLPTGDRDAESRHQRWLQQCPSNRIQKVYIPSLLQSVNHSAPTCSLPSPENWHAVKSKILLLLDPDAPSPLIFQTFNRDMGLLLNKEIWSGKQYEAQQHTDDSICWLKAREGAQEILHRGVIHASLEIPSTWSYPQFPVATKTGTELLVPIDWDVQGVAQAAVAPEAWFGIELVGYQAGQADQAERVASSYKALGYQFVQAAQQLKDAEGHTIPRSRYQIDLLFKSRRQQQDACRQIRAALPSSSSVAVSTVDLEPSGYDRLHQFRFKADPHYLNDLYSVPLPAQERERLLQLAPRYPVPPTTHTTLPDVRSSQEAVYLWRLVHFGIFEYDREFLLPGYQPNEADAAYAQRIANRSSNAGASSSSNMTSSVTAPTPAPTPTSPRTSLPVAELPLARLVDIAFASSNPFPPEEIDQLRRMCLCLLTGKRRAPFTSSIFPFPGSPYRDLLAHVVLLVKQSSQNGIADFSYCKGPPNSSAGVWDEKLSLDVHGRVKISMDPELVQEWDSARDPDRVEAYVARCVQLSGIPRHQKRRKR